MDAAVAFFEGLTLWHWLGLGIILLTIEVAVGTFDLLWVALGAFATSLFSLVAPGEMGHWQGQLVFFFVVAMIFVIMGRTVFRGLRRAPSSHPNLNQRTASMVGQRGEAVSTFELGSGRVKVGDTVWIARQADDSVIVEGDNVVVAGADGTTLKVRLA